MKTKYGQPKYFVLKRMGKPIVYMLVAGITIMMYGFREQRSQPMAEKLYIYEKSNQDGSNKGLIAVYYKKPDLIESFKWHEGSDHATMVKAWMDNDNHTVKQFKVFSVDNLANEQFRGVLEVLPENNIHIKLGDNEQLFQSVPNQWHSYDFDFASLSFAFQSFQDMPQEFGFNILDLDLKDSPPVLKDFGKVEMQFLNKENKWSREVHKYKIDGPGLDHRGGHIWFDRSEGFLVGFEIDKPDEPGYTSGKLVLKEVLYMKDSDWSEFKKQALNSKN